MSDGEITAAATNGDDSITCRQLMVVETVAVTPIKTVPFEVPEGWTVRKVLRSDGLREDKYYYEPGTGKKFQSARAVERYLTGTEHTPVTGTKRTPVTEPPKQSSCFEKYYKRRVKRKVIPLIADERWFRGPEHKSPSKSLKKDRDATSPLVRKSNVSGGKSSHLRKSTASSGKLMKVDNEKLAVTKASVSPFKLPDGWVVKEIPRRNTIKYRGFTDKIYCEPGTGRLFRSLVSVKRHLAEAEEDKPLAEMFNIEIPVKKLDPMKTKPLAEMFNIKCPAKKLDPKKTKPLTEMFNTGILAKKLDSKKTKSRKEATNSTFGRATPPARIKWVLTDDDNGSSTFKPSIGDSMVEERMVQLWANRFKISINGGNCTSKF